jgi:hypothetical protein
MVSIIDHAHGAHLAHGEHMGVQVSNIEKEQSMTRLTSGA